MKKIISVLVLVLMLFSLVSCGSGESDNYYSKETADVISSSTLSDVEIENRYLIKEVRMSCRTNTFDDYLGALTSKAKNLGGYVEKNYTSGDSSEDLRTCELTFRIPAEKLDDFVTSAKENVGLRSYNETVTDVTDSYTDVEARIAVLEAQFESLQTLETQLNAKIDSGTDVAATMKSLLEIKESMTDIISQLESYKARKKAYDSKIDYSTVELTVYETERSIEKKSAFGEIGERFKDSIFTIGRGFRAFFIWFVGNLPYFILISTVAALITLVIVLIKKKK